MWFKNLQIYRLPAPFKIDLEALNEALAAEPLQACSGAEVLRAGWLNPISSAPDKFVHVLNQQCLLVLGLEQKLLPASIVRQFADERAAQIFENEGRKVGKREVRELREALTLELLPRAFSSRSSTFGWIDPLNGWLIVDASSPAKAEQFLENLRKAFSNLPVKLLKVNQSPSAAMTSWMAGDQAPQGFTIDLDMELRSAENAKLRYVKHALDGKEIPEHISSGKVVTRLGLTWNERISFVLDENLQIKRLQFLDILKEENENQADNADERFDLDFALMSGEIAKLLADLLDALGGEIE